LNRVEDEREAFADYLFYRKDSRRAASALMAELQVNGGRCTAREMSHFAKKLEAGELGFKFSKVNFYKMVLGAFLKLGFIEKFTYYDGRARSTVKGHGAIAHPIPPAGP
jgi:hypothetical protein